LVNKRVALVKVFYDVPGTTPIPPLGILIVGGEMRKAGYEVKVFHSPKANSNLAAEIAAWKPGLVGFSLITGDPLDVVVDVTRRVRSALPECVIVYGGIHPTIDPEQCLSVESVDFVVLHDGERTAVRLAEALRAGEPVSAIPGLAYREGGRTVIQPQDDVLHNLDDIDIDWSLVDVERYVLPEYGGVRRVLAGYVASRGCPHQCGFCYNLVFNKRKWRHPSAEKVVRDVNALAARHDLGGVIFHDDNFTANRRWALSVLEGLKVSALHIETRIDYVTEEFLQELVSRNVRSVFFGVECASDRMLALMKKGFTVADTKRALAAVAKYPLNMKLSLIVGGPTETVREYQATLDLIVWCVENLPRAAFTVGFYLPFPGTPLFPLCVDRGFKPPDRLEGWVAMDRWGNQSTPIPWTDGEFLTSDETARIRRWASDLVGLRRSRRLTDRLRYCLLKWRFRHSGGMLVRMAQRLDMWFRWRFSRAGLRSALGRPASRTL
jgi:radical SAM superfamily enzyme YgiQ (UPF0313 family)